VKTSSGENLHTIEDSLDYFHRHLDRLDREIFDLEKNSVVIDQLETVVRDLCKGFKKLEKDLIELKKER
jgi:hypothetical protein